MIFKAALARNAGSDLTKTFPDLGLALACALSILQLMSEDRPGQVKRSRAAIGTKTTRQKVDLLIASVLAVIVAGTLAYGWFKGQRAERFARGRRCACRSG